MGASIIAEPEQAPLAMRGGDFWTLFTITAPPISVKVAASPIP